MRKLFISAVAVYAVLCVVLCGCSSARGNTLKSEAAAPNFNDVFISFSELKATGTELLSRTPDAQWWTSFDSVCYGIPAIVNANNVLLNSGTLSDTDIQLAGALVGVINGYSEGFEIMSAVRNSEDNDIINYAYAEFSAKINSANAVWDSAVAAITSATVSAGS